MADRQKAEMEEDHCGLNL
jgi:hypothetical protein